MPNIINKMLVRELTDSLSDAEHEGQRQAAEIAGELLNYQDRPGKVKFTGPTPIDPHERP